MWITKELKFFGGGGEGGAGSVILGNFIEQIDEQVKTIKVKDIDTGKENFTSLKKLMMLKRSILGVDL